MPHDLMPSEFSLNDADADEVLDGPPLEEKKDSPLAAMREAGRRLVRKVKRTIQNPVLAAAMVAAGAALVAPHGATAQCSFATQPFGIIYSLGSSCPSPLDLGNPADRPGGLPVADPVDVSTGNVFLHVVDYTTAGQNPLQLIRYYNSMTDGASVNTLAGTLGSYGATSPMTGGPTPVNWRTNYDRFLQFSPASSPTTIIAERPDGQQITFTLTGSMWTPPSNVDYTLAQSGSNWILTDHNDTQETYANSTAGWSQVNKITYRNGYYQDLTYSGTYSIPLLLSTTVTTYTPGLLQSVTDSYGRSLNFSYNSNNLLSSVTTPDSLALSYNYTSYGTSSYYSGSAGTLLTSVSYNTSPVTSQTYAYNLSSQWPYQISSVTDENGNTAASWTYNGGGQAVTSTQGGGIANSTSFSYNSYNTVVTNAYGVSDTYNYASINGAQAVTSISRAATTGAGHTASATESFTYDGYGGVTCTTPGNTGFLCSRTDWNGNQTNFTDNIQGNPTQIQEGIVGTSAPLLTTNITYDTTWTHLPATIVTPGYTLSMTYSSGTSCPSGDLCTLTQTDTTTGSTPYSTSGTARTWAMNYNSTGQLLNIAGPRTDLTQETQFSYSGGTLTSITDPLSHVTTINTSTGGGYPTKITDPNSVVTTLGWDTRLNLNTVTVDPSGSDFVTTYTHDPANRLISVSLPDRTYPLYSFAYNYDAANRLTQIENANSETINFSSIDQLGNPWAMNIKDAGSTIRYSRTAAFDNLGRILTGTDGVTNTTTYTWDPNSNLASVTDPNSNTTGFTWDGLNRLSTVTYPLTGSPTATLTYDAHNAITQVTDPNGHSTSYTRDGFERPIQIASPDSGTSVYHFDLASNLTQKTDGAGNFTCSTFDAANRELTRAYSSCTATPFIFKTYDQTGAFGFGVGHLTTMSNTTSVSSSLYTRYIAYDERGNDIGGEDLFGGGTVTFNNYKYYDAASRLTSVILPSGWAQGWSRDAAGQVTGIGIAAPPYSSATLIAGTYGGLGSSPITHLPFGPVTSVPYGNGITRTNSYDNAYDLTNITDAGTSTLTNLSYGYDGNRNVACITDGVNAANSQIMTYDNVDRLLTASSGASSCASGSGGGYGSLTWTYDANGNRLSQTLNGGTPDNYTYNSGTNQVNATSLSGFGVSYNGAGATTAISVSGSPFSSSAWNQSEQQLSVTFAGSSSPAASYSYDGLSQRLLKTTAVTTAFTYGGLGNLAEESNTNPQTTDYIPLDPSSRREAYTPVGMIAIPAYPLSSSNAWYFVHTDRLGTPQTVTDTSQNVQWAMTYTPFGAAAAAITNPNNITQNLRFPGMYSDPETGLYHNGARDYVPTTGLYFKTDPIGLAGGLNTYQYAKANPFKYTDRRGLDPGSCPDGGPNGGGPGGPDGTPPDPGGPDGGGGPVTPGGNGGGDPLEQAANQFDNLGTAATVMQQSNPALTAGSIGSWCTIAYKNPTFRNVMNCANAGLPLIPVIGEEIGAGEAATTLLGLPPPWVTPPSLPAQSTPSPYPPGCGPLM